MTTAQFTSGMISARPQLKKFALRLSRNVFDAEDLVQQTYLKAMTYRNSYNQGNIKNWLFTILKNTFVDQEKEKRMNYSVPEVEGGVRPDSIYSERELLCMIKEVRPVNRVPFQMLIDGYKYDEIAQILNVSIGTVKSRIFSARKEIIKKLKS